MSDLERELHRKFLERLDSSRPSTFRVAEWLHKRGYSVTIPAIRYTPSVQEQLNYVDSGDVFIEKDGTKGLVEVKHSRQPFTCREDWPFDNMFMSNKAASERLSEEVTAYIIVNKFMTHMGIIYHTTKNHWYKKSVIASNTQRREIFMACPIQHVEFRSMD